MAQEIRTRLCLFLSVAIVFASCARRELSAPPPDPIPMARDTYVIGIGDALSIVVWNNSDLSLPRVPVRADGMVSMPLLDDVQAEGLQPMELKEVISRELSEYITAPDVTVTVLATGSRFVSIVGEVPRNTQLSLHKNMRILEAIASAGGFTNFADKSDIRIVRGGEDGSEVEYRFDYDAYIKGNAPGTNIVLQPGDTIIVPE